MKKENKKDRISLILFDKYLYKDLTKAEKKIVKEVSNKYSLKELNEGI